MDCIKKSCIAVLLKPQISVLLSWNDIQSSSSTGWIYKESHRLRRYAGDWRGLDSGYIRNNRRCNSTSSIIIIYYFVTSFAAFVIILKGGVILLIY